MIIFLSQMFLTTEAIYKKNRLRADMSDKGLFSFKIPTFQFKFMSLSLRPLRLQLHKAVISQIPP